MRKVKHKAPCLAPAAVNAEKQTNVLLFHSPLPRCSGVIGNAAAAAAQASITVCSGDVWLHNAIFIWADMIVIKEIRVSSVGPRPTGAEASAAGAQRSPASLLSVSERLSATAAAAGIAPTSTAEDAEGARPREGPRLIFKAAPPSVCRDPIS